MKIKSILIVSLFLMHTVVFAEGTATRSDDGNQALKRMQYMLKQLTNEKAELEIDIGKLNDEVKSLEKELKKAKKEIEENELSMHRMQANINGLNGTVEKRDAKIGDLKDKIKFVGGKYKDARLLIRQLNFEKEELEGIIVDKDNTIADFDDKNLNLYKANLELMELYENKTGWDSVFQKEGVTGLKQVEIENILQEYKFKLEDNRTEIDVTELGNASVDTEQ